MPSDRHINPRDGYLDAARDCILDIGWRRASMTEVARRAGVSRMTIYRAWPDMPALLSDLMTREWADLIVALPSEPTPESLAAACVNTVAGLRDDPLFERIVAIDPELLLPYLFERRGRNQDLLLEALTTAIRTGQRAGTIRDGRPSIMARGILLLAHGFVLSAETMADGSVTAKALDRELATALRAALTP